MSLPISSCACCVALPAVLLVAACTDAQNGAPAPEPEPDGTVVECAIGPDAQLSAVCTLERPGDLTDGEAGNLYLIHHPDGGFRRVAIDLASGSVSTVDGAQDLTMASPRTAEAPLDFTIGEDRYVIARDSLASGAE